MLVILGEQSTQTTSVNAREMTTMLETAKLFGGYVYVMPPDFSQCETAENALAYLPEFDPPLLGIWVGYIPSVERYTAIYEAALRKGVKLVNTPDQHRMAMEFSEFYPLLSDLTPKSMILESLDALGNQITDLDFPLFVKGGVKSNKERGLSAVLAASMEDLNRLAAEMVANEYRSRGKLILREWVQLRKIEETPDGFPVSREYRVLVYKGDIVAYSFYWEGLDDPEALSSHDKHAMLALASEAASRLNVPFIAIDLGQLENGDWIVIETGDAQFCGLSQLPVLEWWSKIKNFR